MTYWQSCDLPPLQLVFITEYMTSGSLLQFLKTKKRNTAATVAGEKSKKASKVRRVAMETLDAAARRVRFGRLDDKIVAIASG